MAESTAEPSLTQDTDLGPNDFETPEEYRRWATIMLRVYSESADENIKAAERLISAGIEIRGHVMATLDRAKKLSEQLARFLDEQTGTDIEF